MITEENKISADDKVAAENETYDFDRIIPRKNTDCIKYDFAVERGMPEDILPLWVADMDLPAPDPVIKAMKLRCDHGIFGYTDTKGSYMEALQNWFSAHFNWTPKREWLVKTPGVVYALCTAIRALTKEGDPVLVQQPVYYPFAESIEDNDRKLIVNQLRYNDGVYSIDFNDFEKKIVDHNIKLFILCNPHNPVGRVWTGEELIRMGEICLKHGVTVISDEIHADFTYDGYTHKVFTTLKPEFEDITIVCTAPSKTFNLAGLQISNIFIPNRELRHAFKKELSRTGFFGVNILGATACQAAYEEGGPWLSQLKEYLKGNLDFVRSFLKERLPEIKLVEPQGTYLIWLDCSALGLSDRALDDLIVHKANLWLDGGTMFGMGGEGFQRFNIACPRATLKQAFEQLESALKKKSETLPE